MGYRPKPQSKTEIKANDLHYLTHKIAKLEVEIYGEIVSMSVCDHIKKCSYRYTQGWLIPNMQLDPPPFNPDLSIIEKSY